MSTRPLISLFTDAGRRPETGDSSWAFWCKRDGVAHSGGGALKKKTPDSFVAEYLAVVNALHFLTEELKLCSDHPHILIQTDSTEVVRHFVQNRIPRARMAQEAYFLFVDLRLKYKLTFTFRHVKGHTKRGEARHWVNNLCDSICSKHLPPRKVA